jgi:hypothetical protein
VIALRSTIHFKNAFAVPICGSGSISEETAMSIYDLHTPTRPDPHPAAHDLGRLALILAIFVATALAVMVWAPAQPVGDDAQWHGNAVGYEMK